MKKQKLNYRLHNPNSEVTTADFLLKILMETNTKKIESAIEVAAATILDTDKNSNPH